MNPPDALTQQPELTTLISSSPDVLSGTPVFRGTRVPLQAVFDNLADGLSLHDILSDFPTLDHEDVAAVLRHAPGHIRQAAT